MIARARRRLPPLPCFPYLKNTLGGCGSDWPSWPTPRRSGRSTTPRSPTARTPSTWCPGPWPSRRPGSSGTAASTRPRGDRAARRRDRGPAGANGEIVLGFGSLSPFRERSGYSATAENSVYVDRAAAGPRGGRALLAELLVLASAHGFHAVIARIAGHNETSIGLHTAAGFELVGVEREVGRKHRHWLDVVELQWLLWSGAAGGRCRAQDSSAALGAGGCAAGPADGSGRGATTSSSSPSGAMATPTAP